MVQCGVPISSSRAQGLGRGCLWTPLAAPKVWDDLVGATGLAVPQSTATARWVHGTQEPQLTGTIQLGWKTLESQDWALGKGCRDESNYPQGYGHKHSGSVPGTQAGRIRTLHSGVGMGQSQKENPFCGGILRLSLRPLVAGQEGSEQPQLSSSQFLLKQSVYFLCGFMCSA